MAVTAKTPSLPAQSSAMLKAAGSKAEITEHTEIIMEAVRQ
jgi:hypothetical protein